MIPLTRTQPDRGGNKRRRAKVDSHDRRRAIGKDAYAISGRELSDLLSPMTPATFMAEYWGRKPLFIKGRPDKLPKLFQGGFDRADFYRAIHRAAGNGIKGLDLQAINTRGIYPDSQGPIKMGAAIQAAQMEEMFAQGANISAENISDPRLASFAAALKAQLQHTGEIHLFVTLSPGEKGFPLHLDQTDAFFMQCEGTKRYVISTQPVVSWPRGTIAFAEDGSVESCQYDIEPWEELPTVERESLTEIVMEPGDILYSPAGTLHATEAVGGATLNLNLLLYHSNFLDLLNRALAGMLASNPAWRHLPQVSRTGARPGQLPAEVKQFFAARLDELRETLNGLTPDASELNREWHKLIAEPGEVTLANLSLAPAQPRARSVQRRDQLRLSRRAPITCAVGNDSDGTPEFYLYYGKREVSVAGEWVPFLQTMVAKRRFTAESATTWAEQGKYPWKIVREYLETLLDQGILERAVAGG